MIQWLRLCPSSVGEVVLIPIWGTKIPYARQLSQKMGGGKDLYCSITIFLLSYSLWPQNPINEMITTNCLLFSFYSIFTLFHYPIYFILISLIIIFSYFCTVKSYSHFSISLFNLSLIFDSFWILSSLKHLLQLGLGNSSVTWFLAYLSKPAILVSFGIPSSHL